MMDRRHGWKGALVILSLFVLMSCSEKPQGPVETAISFKNSLFFDDVNQFQSLFTEHRRPEATKEWFEKLKGIQSSKAEYEAYTLIKLDNGEMLLVQMTPKAPYQIQDIRVVPAESRSLFGK